MEYKKHSVNGNAGEYLVAYTITRIFGWPCRLYGIDLGVDAEMEVIDEDGRSTGDIIKIQIKTFESLPSKEVGSVYVDERHISYWKRFCLPVIICCVDLANTKIYWKQITATEAFHSRGESKKVKFCFKHDILDKESLNKLRELVCPSESKSLEILFQELNKSAEHLPSINRVYTDFESIEEEEKKCDKLDDRVKIIENIISHFPWRISLMGMRQLNNIKSKIQATRNNLKYYQTCLVEGS